MEKNFEHLAKELDNAVKLLSPIAVSHDAVDAMAAAKQKIYIVKAELIRLDSQEKVDDRNEENGE